MYGWQQHITLPITTALQEEVKVARKDITKLQEQLRKEIKAHKASKQSIKQL